MSTSLKKLIPTSESETTPLTQAVIFLVIVVSFVWVILYSSTLSIVCAKTSSGAVITDDSTGNPVIDKSKCLVGAFLVGLLSLVGMYLIRRTK